MASKCYYPNSPHSLSAMRYRRSIFILYFFQTSLRYVWVVKKK